ncbi:MAG: hypothetical protein AAF456_19410 [Planctomycetota bacterium]
MYDHERSLVTEMEGKPFKLIGVNFGDELDHIKAAVKDNNLNWRSFFLGEDPTVVEGYAVRGFPTVLIIDADGIVRWVGHGSNDDLINELLAEMDDANP